MSRPSRRPRDDRSRAPDPFRDEIDGFLTYIALERGLSANTAAAYRRDLDQAAAHFARAGAAGWRTVTPEQATAWVRALSADDYKVASLARKLSALRMLSQHLLRERIRDDDFGALLTMPKAERRIPHTLTADEAARLMTAPSGGDAFALAYSSSGWIAIAWLAVPGGFLSFYFWFKALERIPASRVALCIALNPLSAALGGALVLGEAVGPLLLVGFVFVAAAIALVARGAEK